MFLNVLLIVYACLAAMNTIFMVALHFLHDRKGYYKVAAGIWAGTFIAFAADGFIAERFNGVHHIFGIPLISIATYSYAKLTSDIYEIDVPFRLLAKFSVATWVIGAFFHFALGASFMISSFIICVGMMAPTLWAACVLFRSGRSLNIMDRLYCSVMVAQGLHLLDYPFLRNIEGAAVFGFSFGLFLIYFASMLIPVIISHRISTDLSEGLAATKSEFLANISHELRTPMHGILSYARFGQQKIESAPKEKLKSYFDEIYESGLRLMRLLNDLLDLSKLEAGKVVYAMQERDLVEIVAVIKSEMQAFATEKGLSIEVKHEAQAVLVACDQDRIMQVLRNLVSNAIKFSTGGAPVRMELSTVEQGIQCVVSNKGVGIPQDELETVFDKFVQSSKTKSGAGGTGLGLAICKEIVEQHHGKIWAESDPGGETRFIMRLPLDRSKLPRA